MKRLVFSIKYKLQIIVHPNISFDKAKQNLRMWCNSLVCINKKFKNYCRNQLCFKIYYNYTKPVGSIYYFLALLARL